jgi:cytoskeletal protein CcmA (bactofilin family)
VDRKRKSKEEINALLGWGTEFEGKMTFEGAVRVDGKFTGEVQSKGMLIN